MHHCRSRAVSKIRHPEHYLLYLHLLFRFGSSREQLFNVRKSYLQSLGQHWKSVLHFCTPPLKLHLSSRCKQNRIYIYTTAFDKTTILTKVFGNTIALQWVKSIEPCSVSLFLTINPGHTCFEYNCPYSSSSHKGWHFLPSTANVCLCITGFQMVCCCRCSYCQQSCFSWTHGTKTQGSGHIYVS